MQDSSNMLEHFNVDRIVFLKGLKQPYLNLFLYPEIFMYIFSLFLHLGSVFTCLTVALGFYRLWI